MINKAHRVGAAPAQSLEWGWPLTSRRTVSPSLCHLPNFENQNFKFKPPGPYLLWCHFTIWKSYKSIRGGSRGGPSLTSPLWGASPPAIKSPVTSDLCNRGLFAHTPSQTFLPNIFQTKTRFLEAFHIFLLEAFHIIEANHYKKHMLCLKCLWLMAQNKWHFSIPTWQILIPHLGGFEPGHSVCDQF